MIRPVPFLLAALLLYVFFTLPLIPIGADDIQMSDVFSADEALAAATLRHLHHSGTLQLETFSYGGLFYYLPLLVLKTWGIFAEVTDRMVLVTLRMFCVVSGLGCLWLAYRIGGIVSGPVSGVVACFLLLTTPTFLRWSVEIHPDLPQLFWMMCALHCCCELCRGYRWQTLCFGALFAGLAAGTKYGGVFLVPLLASSVLLSTPDGPCLSTALVRLRDRRFLLGMMTIPIVFAVVFVATNPYAIINFEDFRRDVDFEREHLSFGHMFETSSAGFSWLWNLIVLSGYAAGILATIRAFVLIVMDKERISSVWSMLLLWIGGYMAFLVLTVNFQAMRHLLPVLVPLYLLAGDGAVWLWGKVDTSLGRNTRLGIVSVSVVLLLGWNVVGAADLFKLKWSRLGNSSEIAAGRWIADRYPEETSIVFDAYSYVPSKFRGVFRSFGQSYPLINHLQPDLLVVRNAIADRYGNRNNGDRYQRGVQAFLDHHLYYYHLAAGHLSTYKKVKMFEGIAIYERTVPKAAYATRDNWLERVMLLGQGQLYGQLVARQEMGDFLASKALWTDAVREFQLASDMVPDSAVLLYKLGRMHLEMGDEDLGTKFFDRVWVLVADKPSVYRAEVRHEISQQYFATGFYQQALEMASGAKILDDGHQRASFNIGLYHLALGNATQARAAYTRSVRQFGIDRTTVDDLRELIRLGISNEDAEEILVRFFGEVL
jgi:tetratricopeptide (TPR) repeat protein